MLFECGQSSLKQFMKDESVGTNDHVQRASLLTCKHIK